MQVEHALYPYQYLILDNNLSPEEALSKVRQTEGRIFLLPREDFKQVEQLEPLVDKGALVLIRRSDIKNSLISADERDAIIEAFVQHVFIQGYSPTSSKLFLNKGASILIDGQEPSGGMTAESILELVRSLGAKNKIKVSRFQISETFLLHFLKKKIKMVFSCKNSVDCDRQLLKRCLLLRVPNLIVSASDFSQSELAEFLQNQATVVITGQDKVPIQVIKSLAFNLEEEPIPVNRLLKVFPNKELAQHLADLKQLHDDQKIELLKNDDWYFNTSLDRIIA